jgi:glycosyltransferase involved in cell wall biosynthesis
VRPIVLNARAAARPELGGVERWARELSARLPLRDPGRYRVARPPAAFVHRAGHAWEQSALPLRARRIGARLIFNPANTAPVAWPGNVVVIHDVAVLRDPSWYSRAYVCWQRVLLGLLARRALHVVTVSQFSAGEIGELLGVSQGRMSVIAGGVDERLRPDADPEPAARALGLSRPYVLCVASATARKNLGALGPAAARLDRAGIDLVVAGGTRPQFRDPESARFRDADPARFPDAGPEDGSDADRRRPEGDLRRLGAVPDRLLPGLYAGARAFALPSLHEGFGLTCLEAMACATPVVASDRGALPETCGDAAVLVDPEDREGFADAVEGAIEDAPLRERLIAAGLERARGYRWETTADAVHALLERLDSMAG